MSVKDREKTAELLVAVAKGRAVVVVEHDMEFVKQIAHQVTVLHQGKVLAEGPMDLVQKDPRVIEVYLGD
jgi:urea transport system ATP-binding protein